MNGLYAIADVEAAAKAGHDLLEVVDALLGARVCVLQLRDKHPEGSRALLETARAVAARCRAAGVPFVMNDRVDIALLAGADGVHLGQDDLPVAAARRLMPAGALVGVSTHNLAQVEAAVAGGADYLGFGPVFATATKENPDPVVGLEGLAEAVRRAGPVPVVAIGGITSDHIAEVAATGAACAAVIGEVLSASDPGVRAAALHRAFQDAAPQREAR